MVSLWQQEELWGHLPLFLFLAAWAFIVILTEGRYSKSPKKWRWLGLATASGIILSLGFPPIPLTFLMFLGFVPLLILEHELASEKEGTSKKELFKYSYHTFVLWNILTTFWVANTAFIAGIFAIWVNSLLMTIPILLFHQTKKKLPKLGYWAFIVFWLAFEYCHLNWQLSWSWLNLGNAFAEFPSWVQWYEYTGVFGGSLWILGANLLAFKILNTIKSKADLSKLWQSSKKNILQFSTLILLPIIISISIYSNYEDKGKEVEVVVIQPNYEPHYEKFKEPFRVILERHLRISRQAVTDSTDYLLFPETSFSYLITNQLEDHYISQELKKFTKEFPKLNLVSGIIAVHFFEEGEEHSPAVRTQVNVKGDTSYLEVLNAAFQIADHQTETPFYIKSKLVPGAERFPYKEALFLLQPIVDALQGSVEGHGIQEEREAFASPQGKIAPVVCYESIYGDYHTGYINAGAEAIFIMTNDGWWDETAGHKQHLKFARLRAIETRRSVARSANTGISAFLNQRGDIIQATKYGEETAIKGKIKLNQDITLYVKVGDFIGRVAAFLAGLLILNLFVKRFLMTKNN